MRSRLLRLQVILLLGCARSLWADDPSWRVEKLYDQIDPLCVHLGAQYQERHKPSDANLPDFEQPLEVHSGSTGVGDVVVIKVAGSRFVRTSRLERHIASAGEPTVWRPRLAFDDSELAKESLSSAPSDEALTVDVYKNGQLVTTSRQKIRFLVANWLVSSTSDAISPALILATGRATAGTPLFEVDVQAREPQTYGIEFFGSNIFTKSTATVVCEGSSEKGAYGLCHPDIALDRRILQLAQPESDELLVVLKSGGRAVSLKSFPLRYEAVNFWPHGRLTSLQQTVGGYRDRDWCAAAFVDENSPLCEEVIREATNGGILPVTHFDGYAQGPEEVERQIYAITRIFIKRGITYDLSELEKYRNKFLSDPAMKPVREAMGAARGSAGLEGQTVRSLRAVWDDRHANCLDACLFYASVFEHIGLHVQILAGLRPDSATADAAEIFSDVPSQVLGRELHAALRIALNQLGTKWLAFDAVPSGADFHLASEAQILAMFNARLYHGAASYADFGSDDSSAEEVDIRYQRHVRNVKSVPQESLEKAEMAAGDLSPSDSSRISPAEAAGPPAIAPRRLDSIVLGGGSFWTMEEIYKLIPGVMHVTCGYAGGAVSAPTLPSVLAGDTGHAEVVKIDYDPAVVSLQKILGYFWEAHDPTQKGGQGNDVGEAFRSIILYADPAQKAAAEATRAEAQNGLSSPIVTEIAPLAKFWPAEEGNQDYFEKNPGNAYCSAVVRPRVGRFIHLVASRL